MKYITFNEIKQITKMIPTKYGMSEKELDDFAPLLLFHYNKGDYFCFSKGKSYVFVLVHGVYIVTYKYFRKYL